MRQKTYKKRVLPIILSLVTFAPIAFSVQISAQNAIRDRLVQDSQTPNTTKTAKVTKASSSKSVSQTKKTKTSDANSNSKTYSPSILATQIALAKVGISTGSLDGFFGKQTHQGLRAFQSNSKLLETGELDKATKIKLQVPIQPTFKKYTISAEDLARLQTPAKTWLEKSELKQLDYNNLLELVAEKSYSHPNLIKRLNPKINWQSDVKAGTIVQVPDVKFPATRDKIANIKISLSEKTLRAFSANDKLIAQFPCSIAKKVEKRPVGELKVVTVAENPNYTFDPENFPESAEAQKLGKKLILPAGANNPVGAIWIGLNVAGYGIHGTPAPEEVGRTESHGCFRMTNWDVQQLYKIIKIGTPVTVEP
ncbi:MAG: murein L,D-transpeptidase [Pyrinomonadaceae bacterium]|nr:murein L,D-transpeptidase [Pyrinomonadaceae bacterium]